MAHEPSLHPYRPQGDVRQILGDGRWERGRPARMQARRLRSQGRRKPLQCSYFPERDRQAR